MCHAHTTEMMLSNKSKAIIDFFFQSSVPPRVQVDVPVGVADELAKRPHGPYLFREAQVSHMLTHYMEPMYTSAQLGYRYWQEKRSKYIPQIGPISLIHNIGQNVYIYIFCSLCVQAAVFKHLYSCWLDYRNYASGYTAEEMQGCLDRLESQLLREKTTEK